MANKRNTSDNHSTLQFEDIDYESSHEESACSVCGRFISHAKRCPYCGSNVTSTLMYSMFRYSIVALALIGLPVLYLLTSYIQPRIIPVDEISPALNYSQIGVRGWINDDFRIIREQDQPLAMLFSVQDHTGVIQIQVTKETTQHLLEQQIIPHATDLVEIYGNVRISAQSKVSLVLSHAENIHFKTKSLPRLSIAEVSQVKDIESILCRATIIDVETPTGEQPWRFILQDETGRIDLLVDLSVLPLNAPNYFRKGRVLDGRFRIVTESGIRYLQLDVLEDVRWESDI